MAEPSKASRRLLFLVGAPHCGQHWVQALLSRHPHVVDCGATRLFSAYLRPLLDDLPGSDDHDRDGLHKLLNAEEYRRLVASLPRTVFAKAVQRKPAARLILDTSPEHGREWRSIARLYPSARFIHMIRDPRTALADLKSERQPTGGWQGVVEQASAWCEQVESVRELVEDSRRCHELRYESLAAKPAETLLELMKWLGLPGSLDQCLTLAAALAGPDERGEAAPWAAAVNSTDDSTPAAGWMTTLSPVEQACVEQVAENLMIRYQYNGEASSAERRGRLAVWAHHVFQGIERHAQSMRQRL